MSIEQPTRVGEVRVVDDRGGPLARSSTLSAVVGALCSAFLSSESLPGCEVAVSRGARGQYAGVVYASGGRAREVESVQETVGVGPGPTALRQAWPVLVDDLATDPRSVSWVGFVERATPLGVVSIYAFPLQVGVAGLGILTLHAERPGALRPDNLPRAFRLTDLVTTALMDPALVQPAADGGSARGDVPGLLDDRHAATHQAVGMVSVQTGSAMDDALALLRAHAFATGSTLVDLARRVVAREVSFRDIGARTDPSREAQGHEGEDDVGDR